MSSVEGLHTQLWTGHRLRLRQLTRDDAPALLAASEDSEAQRLADEVKLPRHAAQLRARLETGPDPANPEVWLGVEALMTGELVGTVDTHEVDKWHCGFEYGVQVFREHWRHGYGSEAVALLLRFYFRELGFHRATATVYAFNEASIAFHRRLGFTEEGRLRENLFGNGAFHDELIFGLLAEEFGTLEETLPS